MRTLLSVSRLWMAAPSIGIRCPRSRWHICSESISELFGGQRSEFVAWACILEGSSVLKRSCYQGELGLRGLGNAVVIIVILENVAQTDPKATVSRPRFLFVHTSIGFPCSFDASTWVPSPARRPEWELGGPRSGLSYHPEPNTSSGSQTSTRRCKQESRPRKQEKARRRELTTQTT